MQLNKHRISRLLVCLLFLGLFTAACSPLVPDNLIITMDTELEMKLPPTILQRIDLLNKTLADAAARGIEIGPETRGLIENINQTLGEGVKVEGGVSEATLARIDTLLDIIARDLNLNVDVKHNIAIDPATRDVISQLAGTIDESPGQWQSAAEEAIKQLEASTSAVSKQVTADLKDLIAQAERDTELLAASIGRQTRCNVDFLGARAGATLDEFIGTGLVKRLHAFATGEKMVPETPIPAVCQILPDRVTTIDSGTTIVASARDDLITIDGYNFVDANTPMAYLVDETGQRIAGVILHPYRSTPYQVQMNLQGIDFSSVPPRARVVFEWPNTTEKNTLGLLLPVQPTPTLTPQLRPLARVKTRSDLRNGPGENYEAIGVVDPGANFLVTGKNGDASWWQIENAGRAEWIVNSAVVVSLSDSVPVVPIPLPPTPTAIPTTPPQPTRLPPATHTPTGTPTPTATPTIRPTITPTYTPTPTLLPLRWTYYDTKRAGRAPNAGLEVRSDPIQRNYVVTGVGLRVHDSNLTTLHLEVAPIRADGTLGERENRRYGPDPDAKPEAVVLAGEQEVVTGIGLRVHDNNVTTIKLYVRRLDPATGALGDVRVLTGGGSPNAGVEVEHYEPGEPLVVIGVGARVHDSNVTTLELQYGVIERPAQ
jgi:hypothetical protein